MSDIGAGEGRPPGPPTVVLLAEGQAPGWPPPRDALVLTPNPRAARAAGVPARSLEQLARSRLRARGLQPAAPLAQWRALRRAVQGALAPDDVDGTARALAGTLREVLRAGLPVDGDPVLSALAGASPRLERVVAVARAYRARLAERALVDPAEVLWRAAEGRGAARLPLRVCGYPRIGPAEVAFLTVVAGDGSELVLPSGAAPVFEANREVARALAARGWRVSELPRDPPGAEREAAGEAGEGALPAAASRRALRFPSRDAEARFVLSEVKRLLAAGEAPEAIVLVARDDASYGPLLDAVAWEFEVPFAASYRVPLRDTPVGGFTALLLEAVRDGLPFEPVVRLLAHPFAGGLAPSAWDAARQAHPRGVDAWRPLDARAGVLAWPERASPTEFLALLHGAWRTFGLGAAPAPGSGAPGSGAPEAGASVAPGPALAAADALAFQRLATAAAGLAGPAPEPVERAVFLHDVDALLSLVAVPADAGLGRAGRVALHTPLAVFGARYRHVFVLGAAEGVLPAPVRDDPVLDFAERRLAAAHGLPLEGAAEAARREALSFRAVLWTLAGAEAAGSLTIGCSEEDGIPSPYVAALGLEPVAPDPVPAASDEERRRRRILRADAGPLDGDAVLAAARRACAVERRREDATSPDGHDGVVGEPYRLAEHVFSASQLLDLGQCPFRWLARVPLRLAEPEEAEEDVTPLLRGRLYHRTLELALRRARDADGGDPASLRQRALAALESAFAEAEVVENAVAVPAWPLRRAFHLDLLRRVVAAPSFLPDGAEVVTLERRFPARGADPPRWRGFPVRGVIDRVDRRQEGLVLVDYKTRSSRPAGAQDAAGKARLDLQLPLYLEAAAPALFHGEPLAGAQYYSLPKAEVLAEVRVGGAQAAALDGFAERARAMLAAGRYPVAPDLDYHACRVCDFDLVCRKGPRTERMRAADAFGAARDGTARPGDGAEGGRAAGRREEDEA